MSDSRFEKAERALNSTEWSLEMAQFELDDIECEITVNGGTPKDSGPYAVAQAEVEKLVIRLQEIRSNLHRDTQGG